MKYGSVDAVLRSTPPGRVPAVAARLRCGVHFCVRMERHQPDDGSAGHRAGDEVEMQDLEDLEEEVVVNYTENGGYDGYEEVEEEVVDADGQIYVDDDIMDDGYEMDQRHQHGARQALVTSRGDLGTLMQMARNPLHSRKSVRAFLDEVGAVDDVHAQSSRGYDGVRVQPSSSRLLPVSTLQRVGVGSYVVQKPYQMRTDWRDEQRRDLEICEFFDSLPSDRQIAFRKMLERLGERIPKPLMGSRKYFRSTLAPHVKIPIPSNSKLELLSDQAMNRVRTEAGAEPMPSSDKAKENEFLMRGGVEYVYENEQFEGKAFASAHYDDVIQEEVIGDDDILDASDIGGKNMNDGVSDDDMDGPPPIEPQEPMPAELMPPQIHHHMDNMSGLHRDFRFGEMGEVRQHVNLSKDRWFVVPELRKELIGQTHVKVSRGSIEATTHFCPSCGEYLPRNAFDTHKRKIERWGSCDHYTPRRFPCTEKGCQQRLPSIEKLCNHLHISHRVPLQIKEIQFASEDEFQVFLRDLEGKGGNFRMSRGNKSSREGANIRYYRCNRNVRTQPGKKIITPEGTVVRPGLSQVDNLMDEVEDNDYEEEETRPGFPKMTRKKPSKLYIHGMCTAFFKKIEFPEGRIVVRYCDYHLHSDSVLRIPDDVRERVKELNLKRLPVPVIIKVIKAEVSSFAEEGSPLEERILNLNDKDVRNVLSRCGLKPIRLQVCRNKLFADRDDLPMSSGGAMQGDNYGQQVSAHGDEIYIEQREDEFLEMALGEPAAMVDPNRPPSPDGLSQLERVCYESWQHEDVETIHEAAEKRREAIQLRRRRETVQEEWENCLEKLKDQFFNALNDDQVLRIRGMIDDLHQMWNDTAQERHKGMLRSRRRKTSPGGSRRSDGARFKYGGEYGDEGQIDINGYDDGMVEVEAIVDGDDTEEITVADAIARNSQPVPHLQDQSLAPMEPPHRAAVRRVGQMPQRQLEIPKSPLASNQQPDATLVPEKQQPQISNIRPAKTEHRAQEIVNVVDETPQTTPLKSPSKRRAAEKPPALDSTPSIGRSRRRGQAELQGTVVEEVVVPAPEEKPFKKSRARAPKPKVEKSIQEADSEEARAEGSDVDADPETAGPSSPPVKKPRARRSQAVEKSYEYASAVVENEVISRSGRRVNKKKFLDI
ncbi:unnamed protein product, partial [Mesorhabditis spiculigera]